MLRRTDEVRRSISTATLSPKVALRRRGRREFTGDEGVQGAEAGSELCGGPTALVVEPAEKLCRG
jgi:hypothetical protein